MNDVAIVAGIDMALEQLRSKWEAILPPLIRIASKLSPELLTWLALPLGVGAGLCIALAQDSSLGGLTLFLGAILLVLAMIIDGLDGAVARATGQVTRWGDYLDHTLDRVLDATWVVALAASMFVDNLTLGFAAAFFTLLGSYMGTQAQAVAGSRNYRGFSRADRTVLTLLSVVIMGVMLLSGVSNFGYYPYIFTEIPINPLSIMVFISALGGIWTFLVRFKQAAGKIKQIDEENPLEQPKNK